MLIVDRTAKWPLLHYAAATLAIASLAACGGSNLPASSPLGSGQTSAMSRNITPDAHFEFRTINNPKDLTFNQLLGIDDAGKISGYFGIGTPSHPNKGYTIEPPYMKFRPQNYPGSMQTQVTAINNVQMTAGFWIDGSGVNRGYIVANRVFTSYADPSAATVTQILGLNDQGRAVGFYTDASGINHGFELNYLVGRFRNNVNPPGASNITATAINDAGDIVGFYTARKKTISFLKKGNSYTTLEFPKSKVTMAFGVNDGLTMVGAYIDKSGLMHGFRLERPLLTHPFWTSIDDPKGVGATTINGLNNKGEMVGFYVNAKTGFTDGMLIKTKK
jgi:hypothetical protein